MASGKGSRSRWQWDTVIGTALTWFTFYLFYWQPGVDRRALYLGVMNLWPGEPVVGLALLSFIVVLGIPIAILLSYYVLYHFEFPFIEQYTRPQPSAALWRC
jgi:hypothetical protein